MKITVQVIIEADGVAAPLLEEIACVERDALTADTLGLICSEAKPILAQLQATVVHKIPSILDWMDFSHYTGRHFAAVTVGSAIDVLGTPIKAPRANAICERLMGSVRRECLDHILIVSEAHLRRILKEYRTYFNRSRPHQGIHQHIPDHDVSPSLPTGSVIAMPVLGGLHHDYQRVA